jgi:ABC-type dipeptide/oligopeptide/nickel transport system permease component
MVAYFVRRLVGGVATLVFTSLVIFTSLWYFFIQPSSISFAWGNRPCPCCVERIYRTFKLDKPWPVNYLAWLFDPVDYSTRRCESERLSGTIDVTISGLRIKGYGALTGNLGESWLIERGTPVTDLFGPGLGEFLLATTTAIFLLMAIAVAQRLRRPPLHAFAAHPPPSPLERIHWVT